MGSELPVRQPPPALLLVAGTALVFLTFMRFGLADLGWVVFAPFLAFLHQRGTFKAIIRYQKSHSKAEESVGGGQYDYEKAAGGR